MYPLYTHVTYGLIHQSISLRQAISLQEWNESRITPSSRAAGRRAPTPSRPSAQRGGLDCVPPRPMVICAAGWSPVRDPPHSKRLSLPPPHPHSFLFNWQRGLLPTVVRWPGICWRRHTRSLSIARRGSTVPLCSQQVKIFVLLSFAHSSTACVHRVYSVCTLMHDSAPRLALPRPSLPLLLFLASSLAPHRLDAASGPDHHPPRIPLVLPSVLRQEGHRATACTSTARSEVDYLYSVFARHARLRGTSKKTVDFRVYGQCTLGIDDQRDCLAQRDLFFIYLLPAKTHHIIYSRPVKQIIRK